MGGFDFFRIPQPGWVPRTPAASLRAIRLGRVPPEAFIHASTSTRPLDEEPLDFEGLERALSRPGRTFATSMLLRDVFESLARGRDQESALFGAEGINALESRSLARIGELKAGAGGRGTQRALARQYYELSVMHRVERSVRAFYLRAAFTCLGKAHEPGRMRRGDLALAVDILVALGLLDQARRLLARVDAQGDPLVLLLGAGVAFRQGDYVRVALACGRLADSGAGLDAEQREAVAFWAGGAGGA